MVRASAESSSLLLLTHRHRESIMETTELRNALTPLSLGVSTQHGPRVLWKYQCGRSTSTPINAEYNSLLARHLRPADELEHSYLEPSESPILFVHPKVNLASVPIFGRKLSLESDRFSTSGVAATLGKMELYDNNCNISNEILQNIKTEKVKEEFTEESSSNFHAHEFKKQINKNKKRKSISPKHRSPKVYKTGKKVIDYGGPSKKVISTIKQKTSTETAKKRVKSPKNKSPKAYKIGPFRKTVSSSISSKKSINTCKQTTASSGTSEKLSIKKSPSHSGNQCPSLKVSKCPRTPKLHTAARALIKQHREEVKKEKEKEMEEYRNKILEEQKRQEEEEMLKMRQQTVFKAKPIRKYAPLPIVKKRTLTDPISPNLCKRRRIESSSQSSNSNRTE